MFGSTTVDILVIQRNVKIFLIIISLKAGTAGTEDCTRDGVNTDTQQCCANYYSKNGVCTVCPAGYFGISCITKCPNKTYGIFCGSMCIGCTHQECHHVTGCPSKGSTGNLKVLSISQDIKTTAYIKQTTTIKEDISSPTIVPQQSVTTITLAIIVTGGVLATCLLIIIINQIHGKIKKRSIHSIPKEQHQSASHDDGDNININEIAMSINIVNDNEIGNPTSVRCIEKEKLTYEQIEEQNDSKAHYQEIHEPYLSPIDSSRPSSVLSMSPDMTNRSDYIDAIENNINATPDKDSYLEPTGKKNMYTQLADTKSLDGKNSPYTVINKH